jgi:hypothetical protein
LSLRHTSSYADISGTSFSRVHQGNRLETLAVSSQLWGYRDSGQRGSEQAQRAMGLIDESGEPIIDPDRGKKTPEQGAATIVFAATSPLLANIGGVYLNNSDISPLDDDQPPIDLTAPDAEVPADVAPHSIDPRSARRLWELSERLIERRPA